MNVRTIYNVRQRRNRIFMKTILAQIIVCLTVKMLACSCVAADIEFANKAFRLVIGEDASVKSLKLTANGEECVEARERIPLFTVTQERPFNNEIKLMHMHKRTTYPANRIRRDGALAPQLRKYKL